MILFLLDINKVKYVESDETKKYFFKKDKLILTGSKIIKNELLKHLGYNPKTFILMKNKYGKPYFLNQYDSKIINFNLSHDNQYVTLIYNDNKEVGIDIIDLEKNKKIINNLKNTLHPDELIRFNTNEFFYIWAFKESYYKYIGSGINLDLLKNISYYSRSIKENKKVKLEDKHKIIKKIELFKFKELYFIEINFDKYLITITIDDIDKNDLNINFLN